MNLCVHANGWLSLSLSNFMYAGGDVAFNCVCCVIINSQLCGPVAPLVSSIWQGGAERFNAKSQEGKCDGDDVWHGVGTM